MKRKRFKIRVYLGIAEAKVYGSKAKDGIWEDITVEYDNGTVIEQGHPVIEAFKDKIRNKLDIQVEDLKWDRLYKEYPERV